MSPSKPFWLSKTFWGATAIAIGQLLKIDHITIVDLLQLAGGLLGVVGVRDAFSATKLTLK